MIIGSTIINRESYVNCRVPESLKLQFYALAKSKGKSASSYILELILQEFERENIEINLSNLQNSESCN